MTALSDNDKLQIKSCDEEIFIVDRKVAYMSNYIKDMVEAAGENDEVVPIRNVRSTTLKKVIEFCEYHHDKPVAHIEKPLKSTNFSEYVCDWDDDFLTVDKEVVLELIQAANYLDIKPLLDISCAKVASLIKGKTPEEIRKLFDIVNDFTPEEEKQISLQISSLFTGTG